MPQTQPTTHTQKYHLPVEKILDLLDRGHRQSDVASRFGTSQTVISRIYRGARTAVIPPKKIPRIPVCTCCGIRSVAKGHRFLCRQCWKYGDTRSPSFTEHTVAT